MWRSGGKGGGLKSLTAGSDGGEGAKSFTIRSDVEGDEGTLLRHPLVVVGVDNDKNSQHALKWAADHIITKGELFVLLHVRKKITGIPTPGGYHTIPITEVDEEVASAYREHVESQTKELLLPFRCFCSRRGLQCKEVILEENEVVKAIIEYITHHTVDKIVLGSSSRNAFLRTFGPSDVPATVIKGAPEFCSVYVISKGKISTSRSAPRPNKHPVHRIPSARWDSDRISDSARVSDSGRISVSRSIQSQPQEIKPSQDEVMKQPHIWPARMSPGPDVGMANTPRSDQWPLHHDRIERGGGGGGFANHLDISFQSSSSSARPSFERPTFGHSLLDHLDIDSDCPEMSPNHSFFSHDSYASDNSSLRSFDVGRNEMGRWSNASRAPSMLDFPMSPQANSGHSWSKNSEDVESEIQRLRLELKRTMDMYSSACKEALNARQKAREFQSWKMEEERRIEEARLAEGAAMELVEREKQRCREALEAAEAARRAVEIEHRKRMEIEMMLRMEEARKKKSGNQFGTDIRYRRYDLSEIEQATHNFSEVNKIGEGGYGPVYKAMLDHTLVAIKALRPDATQGRQQFQREVEILSCIRHPNMVLLLGACPENGCLVYEYMANGSLEDRLFRRGSTPPISWQIRFRIAAEIATGLLFLHQTKPEPLVHRDLKPANILLDHNYVSKISDVGLARLVPPSVSDSVTPYHMTAAAGTFCYIDPEYQKTGMLGIKSDIYALGIILLQIITAKPPMGLAHYVERAFEKGTFEEMLDPTVPDWPMQDTILFAKMALRCAELRRKDRPDLGTVVLPELNRLRDIADETLNQFPPGYVRHQHMNSFQEVISVRSGENSSTLTDDGS